MSVAERRARAEAQLDKLRNKGERLEPVTVQGAGIARTFWGKAWCDNLLRYSDFSNRMPRGRSYVRNGHVLDLRIERGKVTARVAGTHLYAVEVGIRPVAAARWRTICRECAGRIGSLVSLLQGRLSAEVMEVITRPGAGLFPEPKEIELSCSCPDWAVMCKHVAAALYGVGVRLDEQPELLFVLRGVDHLELIGEAAAAPVPADRRTERVLEGVDLGGVFGIEVEGGAPSPVSRAEGGRVVGRDEGGGRRRCGSRASARGAAAGGAAAGGKGRVAAGGKASERVRASGRSGRREVGAK